MRRTKATDCWTVSFDVPEVYAALLNFENYPRWWPKELRVRALTITPDGVGSRIEVRPRGSRFVCEVGEVIPGQRILIRYVAGVHLGTGLWTLERTNEGTLACYQIDLEPQGWLVRLLSNVMDFGKMHSRSMQTVFKGLEGWLKGKQTSFENPVP